MTPDDPDEKPRKELGHGLFGYRRTAVNRLISDRDIMIRQAELRARAAEEKYDELAAQLATLRDELTRRDEEIGQLRASGPAAGPPATRDGSTERTSSVTPDRVGEEISSVLRAAGAVNEQISEVLRAAEESAARIVETAQTSTQKQLTEAERLWDEVRNAYASFSTWRQEVDPVLHTLQREIHRMKTDMEEIPGRIQDAFFPLSRSIRAADQQIETVRRVWPPPLLAELPSEQPSIDEASGRELAAPEEEPGTQEGDPASV